MQTVVNCIMLNNDNRSVETWTLEPNHMAHKQAEGVQFSDTHAGERLGSVGLWEVTTGCATHHISPDSAECLFCSKFNLFLCFDFLCHFP